MNTHTLSKLLAAATAGFVLMASAALASPAQSTVSLNVRSGPGPYFEVVDVLYPGERVNVETCRNNGWCFIDHRGGNGWVSSRYLTDAPSYYDRWPSRPPVYYPPRPPRDDYYYGNNGAYFSFHFGTGQPCYRRYGHLICP